MGSVADYRRTVCWQWREISTCSTQNGAIKYAILYGPINLFEKAIECRAQDVIGRNVYLPWMTSGLIGISNQKGSALVFFTNQWSWPDFVDTSLSCQRGDFGFAPLKADSLVNRCWSEILSWWFHAKPFMGMILAILLEPTRQMVKQWQRQWIRHQQTMQTRRLSFSPLS